MEMKAIVQYFRLVLFDYAVQGGVNSNLHLWVRAQRVTG